MLARNKEIGLSTATNDLEAVNTERVWKRSTNRS